MLCTPYSFASRNLLSHLLIGAPGRFCQLQKFQGLVSFHFQPLFSTALPTFHLLKTYHDSGAKNLCTYPTVNAHQKGGGLNMD